MLDVHCLNLFAPHVVLWHSARSHSIHSKIHCFCVVPQIVFFCATTMWRKHFRMLNPILRLAYVVGGFRRQHLWMSRSKELRYGYGYVGGPLSSLLPSSPSSPSRFLLSFSLCSLCCLLPLRSRLGSLCWLLECGLPRRGYPLRLAWTWLSLDPSHVPSGDWWCSLRAHPGQLASHRLATLHRR
jgi:hypothetical protein